MTDLEQYCFKIVSLIKAKPAKSSRVEQINDYKEESPSVWGTLLL